MMKTSAPSHSRRFERGFSLAELMIVMAILATLGGLAAIGLPRWQRASDRRMVETSVMLVGSLIDAYGKNVRNGDYPPTVLSNDFMPGVGDTNELNRGIESVVLCLNRKGRTSAFEIESFKGLTLENVDEDRTQAALSSFGADNRELYELVDKWGTPLLYFHNRDYEVVESKGLGTVLGPDGPQKGVPWKNPKTKTYFNRNSFQLISAGPDGDFNTEDDITNFELP